VISLRFSFFVRWLRQPTTFWYLPYPVILSFGTSFGVQTNGFGFIMSWATNASVVIEASTTLPVPTWLAISTNTISASAGWSLFTDPGWTNFPSRFYRVRPL